MVTSSPVLERPRWERMICGRRFQQRFPGGRERRRGDRLVGLISVADLTYFLPQYHLRYASPGSDSVADRDDRSRRRGTFEDRGRPGASVGDTVRFSKAITEADVETFARLSGDENPIHLDESYAERTRFGRRIVHGALATSLVSAALARLPDSSSTARRIRALPSPSRSARPSRSSARSSPISATADTASPPRGSARAGSRS